MELVRLVDYLWIAVSAALVFFMQAGFAMVESGLTRAKNSINVAIKNLTDLGVSLIAFWAVGFALMFGDSSGGIFGASRFFIDFSGPGLHAIAAFFLFQAMFCSTSATIVSGAVAERMKYSSYILSTLFMSAIIYPVFGHWAWGGAGGEILSTGKGWLASVGFVDFAGSTVVHSVGGYVALAALLVIGPRAGRYNRDGSSNPIHGSNIPLSVAGVMVLWFGWIGFNGGSTLAMTEAVPGIIMRTCLSGAAGMLSSLFAGWVVARKPDVTFVMNGSLAGLVAITAGCHCTTGAEAILIGAVAGVLMIGATYALDRLGIDDAVGAIPVHLACGVWGTLAVGLFGDPAILGTKPIFGSQLAAQAIGVAACGAWSFGLAFAFLSAMNAIRRLRVSPDEERIGLNVAEHGATTELLDLYATMEEQAATGDLSKRVPVEPFTEVGQIAALYNKVIAGLERNTLAREEFGEIFMNVSDGIFLIDRSYRICPSYSAATEKILGARDLAGVNAKELLGGMVAPEKAARLDEFLSFMFDSAHNERSIGTMNPLVATHFRVPGPDGAAVAKLLDVSFFRVYGTGRKSVVHVMAVMRDDTRLATLAKEVRTLRVRLQEAEAKVGAR